VREAAKSSEVQEEGSSPVEAPAGELQSRLAGCDREPAPGMREIIHDLNIHAKMECLF